MSRRACMRPTGVSGEMSTPSTDWRETPSPDEPERHARQTELITAIQARVSAKAGAGRAFHRKGLLALEADFVVRDQLPPHARHGLFRAPASYPCRIRLSNGATKAQSDRASDIRGFALNVAVPEAPGALGGPTTHQDFLLINRPAFGFPTSVEFVAVVDALSRGPLALVWHFISTYGLFAGLGRLRALQASASAPFDGFASTPFYSAAPLACGPYAVRVRILPAAADPSTHLDDQAADVRARLAVGSLRFPFQVQFFVDERVTPIEDATAAWSEADAPWETVADVVVDGLQPAGADAEALAAAVEAATFDPWRALVEHRPLGEVMRSRKVAYFASAKARGAG